MTRYLLLCLTAFVNFIASLAFAPASRVLSRKFIKKNGFSRVFSNLLTKSGQTLKRITSREFALHMFGVGSGMATTSSVRGDGSNAAQVDTVKMDTTSTRSFLNWWFTNQPVRPVTAAAGATAVAASLGGREKPPAVAETASGGFTFDVVAVADFGSMGTTAPMESTNKGPTTFTSLSPRASLNNGVVGFMDIDPKSAASKNHRGRQTWLKL